MKKVSASSLERKNYKWIYLFLTPSILVFLLFYLSPIITVITTSFTKWDGFNKPEFIGLQNYITMFHNEAFLLSLKNLLLWSLIAATLHVGFGILVAFVLFRKPFGWKFTRAVFMVPNVISAAAWALIYKFIFNNDMGVLNNIIRKVNPDFNVQWFYQSPYAFCAVTLTWLFYAVIVTLIVLNDLMAIPEELHEAAKVDGATGWKVITKIQLPLCRNAFGTAIICSVTARVAMYEQIALTTAGGPGDDTMNLPLILVKSISDMKYGYANANGVIMFILGLLILAIINKVFRMNENVY
ncbi:carbohydrate ABC transporter permease [Anaerocolumna jejuensis]|uniref:carbohydrate ABC transporter permease n=1 Tax=Anaerocolumna jejuensis TaxID=259063 RepID=UPI003F7C5509